MHFKFISQASDHMNSFGQWLVARFSLHLHGCQAHMYITRYLISNNLPCTCVHVSNDCIYSASNTNALISIDCL